MKKHRLMTIVPPIITLCVFMAAGLVKSSDGAPKVDEETLKRGEYLLTIGSCDDCHTPKKMGPMGPEPDMSRRLMGHPSTETVAPPPTDNIAMDKWIGGTNANMTAWFGPWGISFAANLTPDNATGTGAWTEKAFMDAMRNGKHLGNGRPILPPMPWQAVGHMTDDDLHALFAYIKTLPAIPNQVPQPIPPAGTK